MQKISINEIIDYSFCPMLYILKYKTPEYKNKAINLLEKYDSDIHKVIYKALNQVQNNQQINLKDIKTNWGKEWIKDKRKANIVFGETLLTKDTYNVKRRKGLDLLMNFYYRFSSEQFTPLIINQEYKIQINKNLTLTNRIELVREMEDGTIQLITFKCDDYNSTSKLNDLKVMADYYICKSLFKTKKIKHYVYNLNKDTFYENNATKKMINFFKCNIINIYKSIYNKLYYLNSGTHCYNCVYKKVCTGRMNQLIDRITDKEV